MNLRQLHFLNDILQACIRNENLLQTKSMLIQMVKEVDSVREIEKKIRELKLAASKNKP